MYDNMKHETRLNVTKLNFTKGQLRPLKLQNAAEKN